ncbi:CHASE domain-containing protein [Ramlibacter sp. AN1015]|uniref:CHASE domain-containing protein n=1 Tax=Ramlibacter sp. AN1015 TaxID=3133428 RepID=UPI0030BEE9E2
MSWFAPVRARSFLSGLRLGRAAMVLAGCLLLTCMASLLSLRAVQVRTSAEVESQVDDAMGQLESRLAAYLALLQATRSFVLAEGPKLDRDGFAVFVSGLQIATDYPGIQGIGWSPRVGSEDTSFRIEYLEPLDRRNQAALGFNMHSEPVRAAAMDRARDRASHAMTGSVVLRQEIEPVKSAGFLIYTPVYASGEPPEAVEQRRALLRGFVYAPFRSNDFFGPALAEGAPEVVLRSVHTTGSAGDADLLYGAPPGGRERAVVERTRAVAGQEWTLRFTPAAPASPLRLLRPLLVFSVGLVISALLFALTRAQARERWRAEDRTQALRQQVQFTETLVGIVSHDLRNPLNTIQLNASMLERAPLAPEFARSVQRIQSSCGMSTRMIRDLLDFTQARLAGGIPVVRTPGDINDIVQQAIDELRLAHPRREIALHVQGDGSGTWDADRIAQVVANLVNNALVYGAADAPITVRLHSSRARVRLSVHNEGEPIPPALLGELFEPLSQGSRAGSAGRNIGLGLYIVRQIVQAHGGTVTCRSSAEQGTRFVVEMLRTDEGQGTVARS